MKRYQVIAILALLIAAGTVSGADAAETPKEAAAKGNAPQLGNVICPAPNRKNSGFVGEDQDGDGSIDHIWRIYINGPCAGETIGKAQVIK